MYIYIVKLEHLINNSEYSVPISLIFLELPGVCFKMDVEFPILQLCFYKTITFAYK